MAQSQSQELDELQRKLSELDHLLHERAASAAADNPPRKAAESPSSFQGFPPLVLAALFAVWIPAVLLGTWSLAGFVEGAGTRHVATQSPWPGNFHPRTDKLSQLMTINDDLNRHVLKLVYAHRLPGRRDTVIEQLGSRSEAFLDFSSWVVERAGRDAFRVAFQPRGSGETLADHYEFEADLSAGTVTPSPKTSERLLAAAATDSGPHGR